MDLGQHPVWQPPPVPVYVAFRQHFVRSDDFPPPNGEWSIRSSYDPVEVSLSAVAYCWPVAFICGILYLAVRGQQRDVVLHCALHVAAGLSVAVAACVLTWCVIGGWGPSAVGCFGVMGVVGGIATGLTTFRQKNAEQGFAPDAEGM